jgi:glycerol-3-phosphate dehydrogenase
MSLRIPVPYAGISDVDRAFDAVVVGGGVLGCFAARNLTRCDLRVALLERREDVCTGISRANTAVIYTGYDTKPGTLKTELCVRANDHFETLCGELGVAFSRCGSLMVGYGPEADGVIREKFAQGAENGVRGLRLLTGAEVRDLEPDLAPGVSSGLYAPGTGTANPWELGIAAYENAVRNGCRPFLNTGVTGIAPAEGGYRLETDRGPFFARAVVNCAGLFADAVQEFVCAPSVRIFPEKADYIVLDESTESRIRHIIFHEPEDGGKGLTIVPTTEGNLLLGPSELPGGDRETFSTTEAGLDFIRRLCGTVVPGLDLGRTIRSFGALRPNPYHVRREDGGWVRSDKSISNFMLTEPRPNFFSLIGIKTPGLTCADELGRYVADKLADRFSAAPNAAFDPVRAPILRLHGLSPAERTALVKKDPAYGRIVCRCRDVSEGEILEAIRRGAGTVDGVKRRTGAGMGRCQGGFCMERVMALLSRELGIPAEALTKDGPGSRILGGGPDG